MKIRTLFWCFALMWAALIVLVVLVILLSRRMDEYERMSQPSWSIPSREDGTDGD